MKTRRTPEQRKRLRQNPKQLKPRKHVGPSERPRFLEATAQLKPKRRIFCELIYYTGCRIQEAHEMCPLDFNIDQSSVTFECLKIREEGVFRDVPVPRSWLQEAVQILELEHLDPYECVWDFCLRTGSRSITKAMDLAGIAGSYANARGLRHSYCTLHGDHQTQLNLLQRWSGHKNMATTFIYMGAPELEEFEEQEAAKVIW